MDASDDKQRAPMLANAVQAALDAAMLAAQNNPSFEAAARKAAHHAILAPKYDFSSIQYDLTPPFHLQSSFGGSSSNFQTPSSSSSMMLPLSYPAEPGEDVEDVKALDVKALDEQSKRPRSKKRKLGAS